MSKKINVFISHSWSHINDLENLKELLNNRGYFNVEFMQVEPKDPIKSENSAYIRRVLKDKIQNSNVVLGISAIYASHSEWMEWELRTAKDLGLKVVGVVPRGQERISQVVRNYANEEVRWNTESIVDAIRRNSNI